MKQRAMIIVAFVTCLWTACMFFPGHGEKQVVVRLDNVEIFCTMPEKGYVVSERQETDDKASVTYECPTLLNQSGYSIIPLFSMHIEKADSVLNRIRYNNRSRAVFEARTLDVLEGPKSLLDKEFIETLQERRYGTIKNRIYQATTTRGKYGIRVVFQVPGEVFDQAFNQIQGMIKSVRINSPAK